MLNQTYTAAICKQQEDESVFSHFTREDAFRLGCMLYENSKAFPQGVSIQITVNELVVFRFFPSGTSVNNDLWLTRKHNMVIAKEMSSQRAQCIREETAKTMQDWCMDPAQYARAGGGFPIRVAGVGVIGSICVSGLAATDDHQLIVDTIAQFLRE